MTGPKSSKRGSARKVDQVGQKSRLRKPSINRALGDASERLPDGSVPNSENSGIPSPVSLANPQSVEQPPEQWKRIVIPLSGNRAVEDTYAFSNEKRNDIKKHLLKGRFESATEEFISKLRDLIGRYRIAKLQDKELVISEREAVNHLESTRTKAAALIEAYKKAWNYPASYSRMQRAWDQMAHDRPPNFIDDQVISSTRLMKALVEFEKSLLIAASFRIENKPKGGKPENEREHNFVRE